MIGLNEREQNYEKKEKTPRLPLISAQKPFDACFTAVRERNELIGVISAWVLLQVSFSPFLR